jgi:hypothetical protein
MGCNPRLSACLPRWFLITSTLSIVMLRAPTAISAEDVGIAPPSGAAAPVRVAAKLRPEALDQVVTVTFNNQSMDDVVRWFSDNGIPCRKDGDLSVSLTLSLKNKPMCDVLTWVGKLSNAIWRIEDGLVVIFPMPSDPMELLDRVVPVHLGPIKAKQAIEDLHRLTGATIVDTMDMTWHSYVQFTAARMSGKAALNQIAVQTGMHWAIGPDGIDIGPPNVIKALTQKP